jgi:hypothetical protein
MPDFYLNSYAPLVASKAGREANSQFNLPPFIDGSIRREPDLECAYPGVSCLCRAGKFAPRLKVHDLVGYMTRKASYGTGRAHRRFTAMLRVIETFDSHKAAAAWYAERDVALSNNCMTPGNEANPLDHSHRIFKASGCAGDARTHKEWDLSYHARARKYPRYVVCEPIVIRVDSDAPEATDKILKAVFGRIPGTQNPACFPYELAIKLLDALQIDAQLFVP